MRPGAIARSPHDAARPFRTLAVALVLIAAAVTGALRAGETLADTAPAAAVAPEPPSDTAMAAPVAGSPWAPGADWDLANLDHERVDHWVTVFTGGQRDEFAGYLGRMGRYAPMIGARLAERSMPQELIFLALIESGFNPTAYSHAHASGLWQFVEETARLYGLDVNRAVDERNDPEKATDAALDHLSELYDRFGSWYLAAAAYNAGQNRVARLMREETGSERGTDESYYRIWERLPAETRDYVPLMIAAARIAKEPGRFGFGGVELDPPLAYRELSVEPATPLVRIAETTGATVSEIRELNPQLKLDRTRSDEISVIRVPTG